MFVEEQLYVKPIEIFCDGIQAINSRSKVMRQMAHKIQPQFVLNRNGMARIHRFQIIATHVYSLTSKYHDKSKFKVETKRLDH